MSYIAPKNGVRVHSAVPNANAQPAGNVRPYIPRAQALPPTEIECLRAEIEQMRSEAEELERERDSARAVARVLAHSYVHDSRPPQTMVDEALAYPKE